MIFAERNTKQKHKVTGKRNCVDMAKRRTQKDIIQEKVNEEIIDHYTCLDAYGNYIHPPTNDAELEDFIVAAFGIRLPRKVVTEGNTSPFYFISDLFFERVPNALGFANRNGGKTLDMALINFLDMLFKENCEITSAGAIQKQADRCYDYFKGFLMLPWVRTLSEKFADRIGIHLCNPRKDSIKSRTDFPALGSRLEIITASNVGFRGAHPNKSRVDEIDEMSWELLQVGLSMAQTTNGIRGQNVFTSTRQYQEGTMNKLLGEAKDKDIAVYQWSIFETVQTCHRKCHGDPQFGDCAIYTYCKGRAHESDGFYNLDDYIGKVKMLDRDTFEIEWENLKPEKHKLVYHMFGPRHIMTPEKLDKMCGYLSPPLTWGRVGGIDFGSSPGHPFVYLQFVQLPNGAWLLFQEYVAEQRLLKDHALAIRRLPGYTSGHPIYADWGAQERMELVEYGIKTKRATKGAGSVKIGIDYIGSLLSGFPPKEEPMLYIWHECQYTIKEWGRYSWPVRSDGEPDKTGNPEKKNDHTSDAARMALYSWKKHGSGMYKGYSVVGV